MRIGELADRAGTTTRSLRYYEEQGLLPARRTANGYRDYDEDDLRAVNEIRSLLAIGFALEDTRPFVECLRAGNPTGDVCPASVAVYRRKLAELDDCIARLQAVRAQVAACSREDNRGGTMLQEVTDADFADRVLTSEKPVLVEFWATWCGPCRMVGPVLERLADEHPEIGIVKMDLDANPATARNYQVMAAPTMLLFEGGEVVKTIVGAKPKAALERELFQPVG